MSTNLITVPLTETRKTDEQTVGTVIQRNGNTYKWVKNASTTTSLPAKGVAIYAANDANRVSVLRPNSASADAIYFAAGVPVTTIAAGEFGWIQTKGIASATVYQPASASDLSGAAGVPMVPSTATDAAGAYWHPAVKVATDAAGVAESLAGTVRFSGKVIPLAQVTPSAGAAATLVVDVLVDCQA